MFFDTNITSYIILQKVICDIYGNPYKPGQK